MKFIAQSTNNKAPMFVAENNVVFPDGDPQRQFIIDEISAILGRGSVNLCGTKYLYSLACRQSGDESAANATRQID